MVYLPAHLAQRSVRTKPTCDGRWLSFGQAKVRSTKRTKVQTRSKIRQYSRAAILEQTAEISTGKEDVATSSATQKDTERGAFPWSKTWYPVAIVRDLDPTRPTPFMLQGKKVVLWRDAEHNWRCFEDVCPHRLAPLTEGRVVGGQLLCSYHGWAFNGEGRCTHIPQALDAAAEKAACSVPRSCAASHPTQVRHGLLWLWPETGPQAWIESAATTNACVVPHLEDSPQDWVMLGPWFARDVPYSFDTLAENLLDPTHVDHAHHGVQGNRNEPAKLAVPPTGSESIDLMGGIKVAAERRSPSRTSTMDMIYQPPSKVLAVAAGLFHLQFYCTPMADRLTRIIFCTYAPKATLPLPLRLIVAAKPAWVDHFERNMVLDGDNVLLHYQEQEARRRKGGDVLASYFMPTPSDRAVLALRRWFRDLAGGVPSWPHPDGPQPKTHHDLLDRYSTHVVHCKPCRDAHRRIMALRAAAAAACGLLLLVTAAVLGGGAGAQALGGPAALALQARWQVAWVVGGAALAGAAAWALGRLQRKFEYVGYVHAEH